MEGQKLTGLATLIVDAEADDAESVELARMMRAIWNNPATQQLLRRETAAGWPVEYQD